MPARDVPSMECLGWLLRASPPGCPTGPWHPPTIGTIDGRAPSCQAPLLLKPPIQPETPTNHKAAFGGETSDHAFAHFRLLHTELMIAIPATLSDAVKVKKLCRCLEQAIEGETFPFSPIYPEFTARVSHDSGGRSRPAVPQTALATFYPRSLTPAAGYTRPCRP